MRIIAFVIAVAMLCGCASYPRYREDRSITPQEMTAQGKYTTDDFIRLGMILRGYLGRPYRGTSSYDDGLDCSLFTQEVYRKFDRIELPRTSEAQYQEGVQIPTTRLSYGDLVFFRTGRVGIGHVGIYVGHSEFIHASYSNGVMISNLTEEYWRKRYVGARRVLN